MLARQSYAEFVKLFRVPAFSVTSIVLASMFYAFICLGPASAPLELGARGDQPHLPAHGIRVRPFLPAPAAAALLAADRTLPASLPSRTAGVGFSRCAD